MPKHWCRCCFKSCQPVTISAISIFTEVLNVDVPLWERQTGGLCWPPAAIVRLREGRQTHGIMQNTCHELCFCRPMGDMYDERLNPNSSPRAPNSLPHWHWSLRDRWALFLLPLAPCRGVGFLLLLLLLLGKEEDERPPIAPQDPNGTVILPCNPSHSPATTSSWRRIVKRNSGLKKSRGALLCHHGWSHWAPSWAVFNLIWKREAREGPVTAEDGEDWKKYLGFRKTIITVKRLAVPLKIC